MMRKSMLSGIAIPALLLAAPAQASSDYLQCDGQSKGMGLAEGLMRFTLILGTLGMAGSPESDNVAERRFGNDGVAACTRAVSDGHGKADDRRRSRLLLARAIHYLEAKDVTSALTDARSFPAAAGEKAGDPLFLRSLGLSAIEIEASALARQGQWRDAEEAALKMAAASPYDVSNMLRAGRFLAKDAPLDDRRMRFYELVDRHFPTARLGYAQALRWNGKFAAAAAAVEPLFKMVPEDTINASAFVEVAIDHLMAGNMAAADALLVTARKNNDKLASDATGKSGDQAAKMQAQITQTDELLAFADVVRAAKSGQLAQAREKFTGRSRWLVPDVAVVSTVLAQLRAGVEPAKLTGALARDPATMRSDFTKAFHDRLVSEDDTKRLYSTIRPILSEGDYSHVAKTIRETSPSKFMPVKQDSQTGEMVTITNAYGAAGSEALLLHSAFVARARGKDGFAILLGRTADNSARVVFASPAESGLAPDGYFKAGEVIADLEGRFPLAPPVK